MDHRPISYARLISLPNVLALLTATCLSRLAGRMFAVAIVFHGLATFHSPAFAGWIAFAAIAPGLLVSPLAGAFLDRAGAVRGIAVDLAVSGSAVVAIAISAWAGWASPALLLLLTTAYALTSPLSAAGVRVLIPRMVPARVLDRANALDTAIHAVVDVVGPTLAGALAGFAGATTTFVVIAAASGAAAICVALLRGTGAPASPTRSFLGQALEGLAEVLRRPLLRGLAIGYSLSNVTWGILWVAVPVVVAQKFAAGSWEMVAGLLWAGMGLAGGIGALASGQIGMLGREVPAMSLCMVATGAAVGLAVGFGMAGLTCGLLLTGLLAGPIDVGLLTLRQRRTDPARLGRVLAVSMSLNMTGFPIGTALGGTLAAWSPPLAFLVAAAASLLAALATKGLIPADEAPLSR